MGALINSDRCFHISFSSLPNNRQQICVVSQLILKLTVKGIHLVELTLRCASAQLRLVYSVHPNNA